jgi:hypothetical protein
MWTDMHPTWAYEVTTATTMPSSIHWAARPPYHLPLALPVSLRVTGMGVVALVLPAPHPIAVLSTPPRQFYHLTPTEMVERRCQGLYYNCDVRGLPSPPPPQCQHLFYLEFADYLLDEAPRDEGTEMALKDGPDAPIISLHTITSICTKDTMHIDAYIMVTSSLPS